LLDRLRADPVVGGMLTDIEDEVVAGTTTPAAGARRLLDQFGRLS
jgi:hypothetical protein